MGNLLKRRFLIIDESQSIGAVGSNLPYRAFGGLLYYFDELAGVLGGDVLVYLASQSYRGNGCLRIPSLDQFLPQSNDALMLELVFLN